MVACANSAFSEATIPRHSRAIRLLLVVLLIGSSIGASAQSPAPDDSDMRSQALQLCKESNFVEALPLLEKLAAAHPNDSVILESLGEALVNSSARSIDPAEQKQIILRARSVLLRARDLGNKAPIIATLLEKLPENGEIIPFSNQKQADAAMREGEAAFSSNDFPRALAAYQRALQLDPQAYAAAVFSGDVYFRMKQPDKAGEWYAKAIAIAPDQETAYRYWGDVLVRAGKPQEARGKFIEAVICDPYQRTTWAFLNQWAIANHASFSHPQVNLPNAVSEQGKVIHITMGSESTGKNDGNEVWLAYDLSRAAWRGDKFTKAFPNEKTYRHSLREEVESIDVAMSVLKERYQDPKKRQQLQPALLTLMELHDKDLIEPFILLSKADAGIAQDYVAYRAEHRDKLREYISEWLIKPAPAAR